YRHHFGAAGRRERPGSAPRSGTDRDRVQGASVPAPDARLATEPADTDGGATGFKAHPDRTPTIGWLPDLQAMTRDDLYGYYRRFYVPNNATLVIVGDVDTDDALQQAERHFGSIPPGAAVSRLQTIEPEQTGERRLTIRKP